MAVSKKSPILARYGKPAEKSLNAYQRRYAKFNDEGERVKTCCECNKTRLYWEDYWPRTKKEPHGPRQSVCRFCKVEVNRRDRQKNWKHYNEQQKVARARRMLDPSYAEKTKQGYRDYYLKTKDRPEVKAARRAADRFYRMRKGAKVGDAGVIPQTRVLLPAGPFREWLELQKQKGVERETLAKDGGRDSRTMRRITEVDSPQKSVEMDYADAILTGQGCHLWELWPDLFS